MISIHLRIFTEVGQTTDHMAKQLRLLCVQFHFLASQFPHNHRYLFPSRCISNNAFSRKNFFLSRECDFLSRTNNHPHLLDIFRWQESNVIKKESDTKPLAWQHRTEQFQRKLVGSSRKTPQMEMTDEEQDEYSQEKSPFLTIRRRGP